MPNYNQAHAFYAGVDLHARSLFVHILNARGKTVFERDLPAEPKAFLDAVAPFRKNLVVGCECMFAWYWLADLCAMANFCFYAEGVTYQSPGSRGFASAPWETLDGFHNMRFGFAEPQVQRRWLLPRVRCATLGFGMEPLRGKKRPRPVSLRHTSDPVRVGLAPRPVTGDCTSEPE